MSGAAGLSVTRFGTPFRLGSTSYVYPADLVANVTRLGAQGEADDVELVLFDLESGPSNIPDPMQIEQMAAAAEAYRLSFTVHLPLDIQAGELETADHPSLRQARRVIDLTQPLDPWAYVFHLETNGVGESGWADQALRAVALLCQWAEPERLALENLESYDPDYLEPVFSAFPLARTLDVGHLWKMGRDPLPVLDTWLPLARVVHLHGMDGRDHRSLDVMARQRVAEVVRRLLEFSGVVTLEVFEDDFFTSRAVLLAAVEQVTHG